MKDITQEEFKYLINGGTYDIVSMEDFNGAAKYYRLPKPVDEYKKSDIPISHDAALPGLRVSFECLLDKEQSIGILKQTEGEFLSPPLGERT